MSRIPTWFLSATLLCTVAGCDGCGGDNDADSAASVGSTGSGSGSGSGACATAGLGCLLEENGGAVFCLEIVDYTGGSTFEDAFTGDCDDEGGTVLTSGCPTSDRVCSIVGGEYPDGTGINHVYGSGPAVDAACGACTSGAAECC